MARSGKRAVERIDVDCREACVALQDDARAAILGADAEGQAAVRGLPGHGRLDGDRLDVRVAGDEAADPRIFPVRAQAERGEDADPEGDVDADRHDDVGVGRDEGVMAVLAGGAAGEGVIGIAGELIAEVDESAAGEEGHAALLRDAGKARSRPRAPPTHTAHAMGATLPAPGCSPTAQHSPHGNEQHRSLVATTVEYMTARGSNLPFGFGKDDGERGGGNRPLSGGMPLFAELQKLMSWSGGPVNWDLARQLAASSLGGAHQRPRQAERPRRDRRAAARRPVAGRGHRPAVGRRRRRAWTRLEWIEKTLPVGRRS